ncbi:hypothetical protein QQ045_006243 [Rhodiola kirilowii]
MILVLLGCISDLIEQRVCSKLAVSKVVGTWLRRLCRVDFLSILFAVDVVLPPVSDVLLSEALKVYQELVKEEPTDFRPYLCQGIIYTLLKKSDEAEKQFQKYKRLVPKEHPYAQYFDDNMIATKVFSQKVARESASSKI